MSRPAGPSLFLLLTAISLSSNLSAQDSTVVRPSVGARVRLTTDAGRIVGTWGGRANDSLTILDSLGNARRVVAVHSVRVLEISRGIHRRTGRGAWIGLLSGAGAGLLSGVVLCANRCSSSGGDFGGIIALALAGGGAVGGTGIGALVGSQVRSERWDRVPLSGIRVGVLPASFPGLHVGVQLAWKGIH